MSTPDAQPEIGAVRITDEGIVEVFDGTQWHPYRPPLPDDAYGSIFRGEPPSPTLEAP